jgi:hypothetical protein
MASPLGGEYFLSRGSTMTSVTNQITGKKMISIAAMKNQLPAMLATQPG